VRRTARDGELRSWRAASRYSSSVLRLRARDGVAPMDDDLDAGTRAGDRPICDHDGTRVVGTRRRAERDRPDRGAVAPAVPECGGDAVCRPCGSMSGGDGAWGLLAGWGMPTPRPGGR